MTSIIRYWTNYRGGHATDPGYVSAEAVLDGGRSILFHCDPDGARPRYMKERRANGSIVKLTTKQHERFVAEIERAARAHAATAEVVQ
jgi:hypothetical protein